MTEEIILKKVLTDSKYFSNVISNLEYDDFDSKSDKNILRTINDLYTKYNKAPNISELLLYVDSDNLKTTEKIVLRDRLNEIKNVEIDIKDEILIDYTEKWVKNKRTENMLLLGADFLDGKGKETLGSIQQKMEDINKLTFKKSAGLDYKKDAMKNFLEYTQVDEGGIKSSIDIINIATGNGYKPGTLTIFASVSNGGKTVLLVNAGADALFVGKNVAYFTFEETELEIRERFDACLLDMKTFEFSKAGTTLATPFQQLINKGIGDLKIKAYGPRSASVLTVKAQIEEWKLKEGFEPDIIILDSITIIAPSTKSDNMYSTGKNVSEEAKALGVTLGTPIVSAIQLGRSSYGATDVGIESISESLAVGQVASTMIGVVLDEHRPDIRLLSIIKSRKVNKSKIKAQNVNIDTDRQKVWDLNDGDKRTYVKAEQKEQLNILNTIADASEKINSNDDIDTIISSSSILDSLLSR